MRSVRAPLSALLALVALGLVAPAAQADPVTNVVLNEFGSPWLCADAGASTSATLTLIDRRTGRTVATRTVAPAATACAGGAGGAFKTDFGRAYLFGGRVVIAPAGSPAVTIDLPYGSGDTADNGATSVVRIGGLPATSTVKLNALTPVAVTGARYTSPPITGYGASVLVTATVSGATLTASFSTFQSSFDARNDVVDVDGTDPLGAPVHVAAVSGGRSATFDLAPGAGALRATLPFQIESGAVVTVSQAGWFSHTGHSGTVVVRDNGFSVAIPTGTQGSYNVSARLFDDTVTLPPTSPLRCEALGPSGVVSTACGTALPDRYSATVTTLFMVAGDEAGLEEVSLARDRLDVSASHLGFSGDDEGFVDGTLQPTVTAPIRVVAARPAGGGFTAAVLRTRARAFDGNVFIEGVGDEPFSMRITRGTTFTLTGPSLPHALRYRFDLAAGFAGVVLSGRAAPHARIRVVHSNGNVDLSLFTTAGADGRFAVTLADPQAGDNVGVIAADPVTRNVSETRFTYGAPIVHVTGVHDQQLVRGTVRVGVSAPAARTVVLAGGELVDQRRTAPPFTFAVNTRTVDDGRVQLTAEGFSRAGLEGFDFLWLIVDNTPPRGTLPSDAFARVGRRLRLHPGAGDANGIASALVTWGDRTRQRLRGRRAVAPLAHVYRRSGTFRVRVTITDRAGNRRVVRTLVHVS